MALNLANFLVGTRLEVLNDFSDLELDEILVDLKVFTVARRGQLRDLLEAAVGPGRSDRRIAARLMPEVVGMEAARRAWTLALDEQTAQQQRSQCACSAPATTRRAVSGSKNFHFTKSLDPCRGGRGFCGSDRAGGVGFWLCERLSKKALKKRMLCMSGGTRALTLKKKLLG